jgi:cell division protease FtsH
MASSATTTSNRNSPSFSTRLKIKRSTPVSEQPAPAGASSWMGEPGVGKTLFAKSFLKASGRTSFLLHKQKADGSFVDDITALFAKAKEKAPSIILLDDLDKFADTEGRNNSNADEYVVLQSCLDNLEGHDVFVIATTNEDKSLPTSLLRAGRFGKVLTLEVPQGKVAEEIIAYYLGKLHPVAPLDIPLIARMLSGHSCATLKEIINEAGLLAAYQNKKEITMDDVTAAILRLLYEASEDESQIALPYRRLLALHEAGHAIVQESLEPQSVTFVSIKRFHSQIEGLTDIAMDPNYFRDIRFMKNRVQMLLAGKAAVEIFAGVTDVGAESDLHRASDIASRFVDNYAAYGFSYSQTTANDSEHFAAAREARLQAELEEAYTEDRRLLTTQKDALERLVAALLEKEIVFSKELQALLTKENH